MNTSNDQEELQTYPLNRLYVYLTEGCNLACRHCWLSPKFDPSGDRYPTLSVERFKTAIKEAKPLGLTSVKLTGGEPLLHPQFKALLEIVRQEGLSLIMETNGTLCTSEVAKEICKIPERFVSVSIDGANSPTHDWIRGVQGSFEQAKIAVQKLSMAGTSPQIIMSVMRCNADQIDDVVRMAEDLGAGSVKFNVVQPTGRGEIICEGTHGLELDKVIELGRYVDTELVNFTKLNLFFDYPMAFRPLSRIAHGDGCEVCGILGILGIIASGHYVLCGIGEHIAELVFGSVGIDPLAEVWLENPILNELRSALPGGLGGVCSRCLMKNRCMGSCIAQNYYRTGSFWVPYWFCEQAEESDLFPESRIGTEMIQ